MMSKVDVSCCKRIVIMMLQNIVFNMTHSIITMRDTKWGIMYLYMLQLCMHAFMHSLHYLGSLEGGPTKMNHHDPFFKLTTKLNKINYLFCCDCAHTYIYILSFIIQSNTKITCNDAYKQILNKIIHNGKNIKFNKSSERKKN